MKQLYIAYGPSERPPDSVPWVGVRGVAQINF